MAPAAAVHAFGQGIEVIAKGFDVGTGGGTTTNSGVQVDELPPATSAAVQTPPSARFTATQPASAAYDSTFDYCTHNLANNASLLGTSGGSGGTRVSCPAQAFTDYDDMNLECFCTGKGGVYLPNQSGTYLYHGICYHVNYQTPLGTTETANFDGVLNGRPVEVKNYSNTTALNIVRQDWFAKTNAATQPVSQNASNLYNGTRTLFLTRTQTVSSAFQTFHGNISPPVTTFDYGICGQ